MVANGIRGPLHLEFCKSDHIWMTYDHFSLNQSEASISASPPYGSEWPQKAPAVRIWQIGKHLAELRHFCSGPIRGLDFGHVTSMLK